MTVPGVPICMQFRGSLTQRPAWPFPALDLCARAYVMAAGPSLPYLAYVLEIDLDWRLRISVQRDTSKMRMRDAMIPEKFATHSLPRSQQLAAWRGWYDSVLDIDSLQRPEKGFAAENLTWRLDGFAISHVSTAPVSVARTTALIRRNPVDHWVVILGKH